MSNSENPRPRGNSPDPAAVLGADAPAASSDKPQRIYVHHKGRVLGRILCVVGWLAVVICVCVIVYLLEGRSEYYDTTGGIHEKYHSGSESSRQRIAIITVEGVIMTGDGYVKHQIDRVREDKNVKAVVLRVNSPGGTVTGSDYIFHHLKRLRDERKIPIVVSMGGIAASGGYYVSMTAGGWDKDKKSLVYDNVIFAEETTTTGSIGVIIPHYDVSELLKEHGVVNDSISSGDRKQMLSMTKPISEENRQLLKNHVNELFGLFKDRIKEGRPAYQQEPSRLDQLATGEIFTARQAKANGLVDEIGFLEDAIDRAVQLARLDKDNVRVIRYSRPPSLLDMTGLLQVRDQAGHVDLSALMDLTAPRAYYLASTLPPLVSTQRAD